MRFEIFMVVNISVLSFQLTTLWARVDGN